ncbi:globin domain-containing protein [Albimonas pacifica]|uniref:Nitric oxide dioxygenase n=1 Tax=Albimonas pacifica TaxID=1114924 RepID=A0A1I3FFV5_9RHOB|nr:globin domain-containing protein [Albimonas pacifica]SFI10108.1 nitric oxide dioxygenase [Albimonas pacifica]
MAFDADRIALLRDQLAALRRDAPDAPSEFYHALFRIAPELRPMFRDEDIGGQGAKFMATLGLLVARLSHPEAMHAELVELGRGHAAYGVKPRHFEPMREALIETLRASLGEAFDAESEDAWRALYDRAAAEMIAAPGR